MKHILKQFTQREAHPVIQFLKYWIAGGIATSIDIGVFYLLAFAFFPAIQPDDDLVVGLSKLYEWTIASLPHVAEYAWFDELMHFNVAPISEELRVRNFIISRFIVFFISNFVAYVMNMLWVFTPGRHTRRKEITLFYVVAVTSFLIGTAIAWVLIEMFGISTTQAYAANLVTAVLINFVARKYWVFGG